jgi:hypothetical protein
MEKNMNNQYHLSLKELEAILVVTYNEHFLELTTKDIRKIEAALTDKAEWLFSIGATLERVKVKHNGDKLLLIKN